MNIDDFLMKLDFNFAHYKGFQYWKEALDYCKDKDFVIIENVYTHIAKKYNVSRDSVEGAMRCCAIKAKNTIKVRYRKKYNFTNKILLNFLRVKAKEIVNE